MSKSRLTTNPLKSSTSPDQEPTTHVFEVQISTVDDYDAESGIVENPQCLVRDVGFAGNIADTGGKTTAAYALLNEEEASEAVDLAVSPMEECKADFFDSLETTHPLHIDAMKDLASALCIRFMYTNQVSDLKDSLTLRPGIAYGLNPNQGTINNINASIQQQDAVDTKDTSELAKGLLSDFLKSTPLHVLNTIVLLAQQSLAHLPPASSIQLVALTTLADALYARFKHVSDGTVDDLDEAISCLQEVAERSTEQSGQQSRINSRICALLTERVDLTGDVSDLERSLMWLESCKRESNKSLTGNVVERIKFATELYEQLTKSGNMNDLNVAMKIFREGIVELPQGSNNYTIAVNNLANALRAQFERGSSQSDLDEAISLQRQALELRPLPHPRRFDSLINLANALSTRFSERGRQCDLDEALSLHRQAVDVLPPSDHHRSLSYNNLATTLLIRFKQRGQRSDLDESISFLRLALELSHPSHPDRYGSLHNFAITLKTRFQKGGRQNDLDEAISLHRQALVLLPPPHPLHSSSFDSLGNALSIRFHKGGQRSDLNEATSLYRQALKLRLPPHPYQSNSLNHLANLLMSGFWRGACHQRDLDEAISLYKEALELLHSTHPNRSSILNHLAGALSTQFDQHGQISDLNEAICLHREVLELLPSLNPDRSNTLNNLAKALCVRYEKACQQSDLDEAMSLFSTATQYCFQLPSQLLTIAQSWIYHAGRNRHGSAIEAYEVALQALPQVVALSLDIESRQKVLASGTDGLARDASRCAILSGNSGKAIEFLEGGRSIFWSQVLSLRSPFDTLRTVSPIGLELANKLQDIADTLELGSYRDVSADILDNRKKLDIDQEASRLNRLNEEWAATILNIRKLPGFQDFLCPPRLSSLQSAASKHLVVFLIANDDESNCLVMTSKFIHHIPLPNLRTPILKVLVDNIRMAVSGLVISRSFIDETREQITKLLGKERGISYQNGNENSNGIFKFVLRMLWDELVKPIIELLDIKKLDDMYNLQWCPTGLFTFLPIHAVGCYDDDAAINCASDYFVSSYTPTLGALLTEPSVQPHKTFQMMAVIQSQELPSTKQELIKIRGHVSSDALLEMGVPGSPVRVEDIAVRLSDVSIAHFACHGNQNSLKPLESGVKLDDGILRISRIMKEKMPNGSLAFLCACETAMGGENLPDEAMSLAASLMFSGLRRVVAIMWQMMDQDGPTIGDVLYRELFCGPDEKQILEPDVTKSAYALHVVVNELRSRNVLFRRWVPFIYMGI